MRNFSRSVCEVANFLRQKFYYKKAREEFIETKKLFIRGVEF